MAEGVDYSSARPDAKCLYDSGKRFVVRYVGPNTDHPKWLRKSEKDALRAAGLAIALTYETSAGWIISSYDRGVRAANEAKTMADGLGITGVPFYFALDVDPRPLTTGQWNQIKACLDGAALVLGRNRVGIYGGYKAIEELCPVWAPWGWQTYAWSAGQWSTKTHLRQYRNGQDVCGGLVDLCRSMTADFGQWPGEDDVTPEQVVEVLDDQARKVPGIVSWERYMEVMLDTVRAANRTATEAKTAANAAVVAASRDMVDEAAIGEAVSLAVVPAVVNAVLEKIPDDIKVDLDLAVLTEAAEAGAKQAFREGTG